MIIPPADGRKEAEGRGGREEPTGVARRRWEGGQGGAEEKESGKSGQGRGEGGKKKSCRCEGGKTDGWEECGERPAPEP